MTREPRRRSVWPAIFAGMVLLAVAYGGAYWWLVEPEFASGGSSPVASGIVWDSDVRPKYPTAALEPLFRPAHWIDRSLLRPLYWVAPWKADYLEHLPQ